MMTAQEPSRLEQLAQFANLIEQNPENTVETLDKLHDAARVLHDSVYGESR